MSMLRLFRICCRVIVLNYVDQATVPVSVEDREFVQGSFPCVVVRCFVSCHVIANDQGSWSFRPVIWRIWFLIVSLLKDCLLFCRQFFSRPCEP
jgi:hypothetical protein